MRTARSRRALLMSVPAGASHGPLGDPWVSRLVSGTLRTHLCSPASEVLGLPLLPCSLLLLHPSLGEGGMCGGGNIPACW